MQQLTLRTRSRLHSPIEAAFIKKAVFLLDFLIQTGNRIIPIEVKAEENPKAKSLAAFVNSYPTLHAVACRCRTIGSRTG